MQRHTRLILCALEVILVDLLIVKLFAGKQPALLHLHS
jgi:hypothetical protein